MNLISTRKDQWRLYILTTIIDIYAPIYTNIHLYTTEYIKRTKHTLKICIHLRRYDSFCTAWQNLALVSKSSVYLYTFAVTLFQTVRKLEYFTMLHYLPDENLPNTWTNRVPRLELISQIAILFLFVMCFLISNRFCLSESFTGVRVCF